MRFETSERIRTDRPQEELLDLLEEQFKKISGRVSRTGSTLEVSSIEASFGSINRNDTTSVSVRGADGGWLVVADVHYRPSVMFWLFFVIGLFSIVWWVLPIVFYILQKNTVRAAISDCFRRVKNEFDQVSPSGDPAGSASIRELEKLGALRERGILTEAEFQVKKQQLLNI